VSAINRSIESQRGMIENLVQTDAAINLGNSGGPLVDLEGKIIAINTAIIPYAQGIGFAIPINSAKTCTNGIVNEGIAKRPWLGIIGLSLTYDVSHYYKLPVDHGVLVTKVSSGSPAEAAGLAEGDIILSLSNIEIRSIEDLVWQIHKHKVGESVRIFALRDSHERYFDLSLKQNPIKSEAEQKSE
jgi:serine protease Do